MTHERVSNEVAVRVATAAHVATVTLDRPPVNALDTETIVRIAEAFHAIATDEAVRAVVLTAAGSIFCAGSDVKAARVPGTEAAHDQSVRAMLDAVVDCPVPVVAAVNGHALGGGLTLVACCDIVVASRDATFGLPEINVGLLGGASYAARLVGATRARRMLLTGVRIPASELHRVGVLDLCVEAGEVLATADSIAAEIASKSPTAVRLGKRSLNAIETMTFRDGYRHEQTYTAQLREHPDSAEAMAAFNERRSPAFGTD
jgi:enoyl-CoA hydratase